MRIMESLTAELTTVTGKIFSGDPTPLIYELLKDTKDMRGLLEYLTGGKVNVSNNKFDSTVRKKSSDRLSLEEWLAGCEKL